MADIERAIDIAEQASGLKFGAFVGALPPAGRPPNSCCRQCPAGGLGPVAVDPSASTVDIVTGPDAQRWLDDTRCRLAVLTMSSRFSLGDIPGGLHDGIVVLGAGPASAVVVHRRTGPTSTRSVSALPLALWWLGGVSPRRRGSGIEVRAPIRRGPRPGAGRHCSDRDEPPGIDLCAPPPRHRRRSREESSDDLLAISGVRSAAIRGIASK